MLVMLSNGSSAINAVIQIANIEGMYLDYQLLGRF